MNIEKIKEYIALRKELYATGVIGLNIHEDEVHINKEVLASEANLQIEEFHYADEQPKHQIYTIRDGIKLFCIATDKELQRLFPQFVEKEEVKNEQKSRLALRIHS